MKGRRGLRMIRAALLGAAFVYLASCNEIAGIDPVKLCEKDSDCANDPEPGCAACDLGVCVLTPRGTVLGAQTAGDCKIRVCDGQGRIDPNKPDDTDIPDDNNPCTADTCVAGTAVHPPIDSVVAGCYTGDRKLLGIGACAAGQQKCSGGVLAEECSSEVLPGVDACGMDQGDLDCDGIATEAANGTEGCCGDGMVQANEECDDHNQKENDGCGALDCIIKEVVAISTGANSTCVLLSKGQIKCWGLNSAGQLGRGMAGNVGLSPSEMGTNLLPVDLGKGQIASSVVVGGAHVCALVQAGLKCWGRSDHGQLGAGTVGPAACDLGNTKVSCVGLQANEMGDFLKPVDLGTGVTARKVAAGVSHTCAILDDGSVKCWGDNTDGQLGIGSTTWKGLNPGDMGDNLARVPLGEEATAVGCGASHTCALLKSGAVKCWGLNTDGQLGVLLNQTANSQGDAPGEMDALPAVPLGGLATAIAVGRLHSCALLVDGRIQCWGNNADGRLGAASATSTATSGALGAPVSVSGVNKAVGIDTSGRVTGNPLVEYAHSCALLDTGAVKCWGSNVVGQLGRGGKLSNLGLGMNNNYSDAMGETLSTLTPIPLGGLKATAIAVGGRHTCVLLENHSAKCWGDNATGQLGLGQAANQNYSDDTKETVDVEPVVNLFGPPG